MSPRASPERKRRHENWKGGGGERGKRGRRTRGKKKKKQREDFAQHDWRQKRKNHRSGSLFSLSLSMDSRPPLRPPLPPGVAGDTAPTSTTAGTTASMRCSSAPASARKVGAESSTSSLLPRKVAGGRLAADPASSSQQQQQPQQPQQPVFCRICLDSDTEGLIAPCQCRGEREGVATGKSACALARSSFFSSSSLVSASLSPSLSLTFFPSHSTKRALDTSATSSIQKKNKNTGTQQYVHVACLRKWQSVAGKRDGDGEFFFLHWKTAHSSACRLFCSFPWTRGRLREVFYYLGRREREK